MTGIGKKVDVPESIRENPYQYIICFIPVCDNL